MKKDDFFTMNIHERVELVNKLLKKDNNNLRAVAKILGINYSTFTKAMLEGDYVYVKRHNQYYPFFREPGSMPRNSTQEKCMEIDFIKENFATLKKVIDKENKNHPQLIIDKRLFESSKSVTKNFRISPDLYDEFTKVCERHYPYLRIQNIIAQLLLNFIDDHSTKA
ncbi:hypothetical protein ACLIA0_09635 [Bacillaceae bacterium W0354]